MRNPALKDILARTIRLIKKGAGNARGNSARMTEAKSFLSEHLRRSGAILASLERAQREEFVPAGITAHCRHLQNSPESRGDSRDVFRRDALQIDIAADRTASIKQMVKRNHGRMKTRLARQAAPRQHSCSAEEKIERGSPAGTANRFGMAGGAVHQRIDGESVLPTSAVLTFCSEIPHKLFSAGWQILEFPMLP
jgi:hypothetical protein